MKKLKLVLGVCCLTLGAMSSEACTGMYADKKVTTDGSVLIGRTVDIEPYNAANERLHEVVGALCEEAENPFDVPVITSFATDFTQGPTTEVPNVSWDIKGPFDRVSLTIDGVLVYDGDTRCGEGRWRELSRAGVHRLRLAARYGDQEVFDSCYYTALNEGEEPVILPRVHEFYSDFYVGLEGDAPYVHWGVKDIVTMEIWVDETRVLVTMEEEGKFRLSQLRTLGSHIVRIVARNVIEDAESSFIYKTMPRENPVTSSAPLLQAAAVAPVINEFRPDAYEAPSWETPFIHWNLGGAVDSLQLTIDNIPVFTGDGNVGSGRWLDVSELNLGGTGGLHAVALSVSNAFGVVTSNFTCTCHWEEPPPPPPGSVENPWGIGDDVQAHTNGSGRLVIAGAGATSNFTDAASLPWADAVDEIAEVEISETVAVIGGNLWAGLRDGVTINGEAIVRRKAIAAGFPADVPSGAISPAEFERIDIVDGKAYLGISVWTNADVTATGEGWEKARVEDVELNAATGTAILTVPATAERGFLILKSRGAPALALPAP